MCCSPCVDHNLLCVQALLALSEVLGQDAIKDVCKSVLDPKVPMKEGYKLMIDSLLQ